MNNYSFQSQYFSGPVKYIEQYEAGACNGKHHYADTDTYVAESECQTCGMRYTGETQLLKYLITQEVNEENWSGEGLRIQLISN